MPAASKTWVSFRFATPVVSAVVLADRYSSSIEDTAAESPLFPWNGETKLLSRVT